MSAVMKKKGLGRGLEALLGGSSDITEAVTHRGGLPTVLDASADAGGQVPAARRHWNDEALDELAASIRAQGLIQPVVVRAIGKNSYELIAGERRWRAAHRAR